MDRISFSDSAAIALLYKNKYLNKNEVTSKEVENFKDSINQNIEMINDEIEIKINDFYDKPIFFKKNIINNEEEYIIKDDVNLQDAWDRYVDYQPFCFRLTTIQNNALSSIGMKIEDGKIIEIEKTENKTLSK